MRRVAEVMIWSSSVRKAEMIELAVVVGSTCAFVLDEDRKGTTAESLDESEVMYSIRWTEVLVPASRCGKVVGGACPA